MSFVDSLDPEKINEQNREKEVREKEQRLQGMMRSFDDAIQAESTFFANKGIRFLSGYWAAQDGGGFTIGERQGIVAKFPYQLAPDYDMHIFVSKDEAEYIRGLMIDNLTELGFSKYELRIETIMMPKTERRRSWLGGREYFKQVGTWDGYAIHIYVTW